MELLMEIFLACIGLFGLLCYWVNRKPKNYPPGPFVWPVLGNFPQIAASTRNGEMHFLFEKYAQKYGKIISVRLGSFSSVVLHDLQLIKEAWNHPKISGRPLLSIGKDRSGGVARGIVFTEGDDWAEQRRFTLRNLRDWGFGKQKMESLITQEAQGLIEDLKKEGGRPISTQNRFNVAVVNALWQITAGERFETGDPRLKGIIEAITRVVTAGPATLMGVLMPWLVKLAPKLIGWPQFKSDVQSTFKFLQKYSQSRLKVYAGDNPEHFTDAYIDEMKKATNPQSSFYGSSGVNYVKYYINSISPAQRRDELAGVLADLFEAGSETTSTTLTWMTLYMAVFPEKQKKLHGELDTVLGSTFPALNDRTRLPYLEATIMETLRFSSLLPLGLFHRATEDLNLGGYLIPKDTTIVANFHAVHFDPQIWGDPESFRPERFLSSDGKSVVKHEGFLAFSYGKRVCIGETLAMQQLFVFASNIFQQFAVTWDPSEPKPSLEQKVMAVGTPLPHKLIFKERL